METSTKKIFVFFAKAEIAVGTVVTVPIAVALRIPHHPIGHGAKEMIKEVERWESK